MRQSVHPSHPVPSRPLPSRPLPSRPSIDRHIGCIAARGPQAVPCRAIGPSPDRNGPNQSAAAQVLPVAGDHAPHQVLEQERHVVPRRHPVRPSAALCRQPLARAHCCTHTHVRTHVHMPALLHAHAHTHRDLLTPAHAYARTHAYLRTQRTHASVSPVALPRTYRSYRTHTRTQV
jgi:hypothetical protein